MKQRGISLRITRRTHHADIFPENLRDLLAACTNRALVRFAAAKRNSEVIRGWMRTGDSAALKGRMKQREISLRITRVAHHADIFPENLRDLLAALYKPRTPPVCGGKTFRE
jgi:hypothetical protein